MKEIGSFANRYDAAVVGGGPAGLVSAIALALAGCKTSLIARRAPYGDNRTTALLGDSIDFLARLDVWRRCESDSAVLRVMRLVDDTGRLIRAPEVTFRADEIDRDSFGFNIENRHLLAALEERASELPNLVRLDAEAMAIEPTRALVQIKISDGLSIDASLVVGADGRRSMARHAAGITTTSRALDQSALTFSMKHTREHANVSTEFHTATGPCVFVPLPGNRSSLVWVMTHAQAERMQTLSDNDLAAAAENQAHAILGKFTIEGGPHVFPLAIEQAQSFAANRIALVGEAAHVMPPIGAQGLNLGLRDASDIAEIAGDVLANGGDPGSQDAMDRYNRARRADVTSRTLAIDFANRSLLSEFLPMQIARAAGLSLMKAVAPLRRVAMREGLAPSWRRASSNAEDTL